MDNEQPIIDFKHTKTRLTELGYAIPEGGTWTPVPQVIITPESFRNGTITFSPNGEIIFTDSEGRKHQVFLYKKDYHLKRYGKPRFHICKCRTIDSFITSGGFDDLYRAANSEPVTVKDLDGVDINNNEKKISGLPLCRNCEKIIMQINIKNSTDFVELLQSANNVEVDLFGYTRDWESISQAYREKHNYVCEHCGLEITDSYDRQYIHVHHKDGNKLNNQESNLQCLCLHCHAHVDDHHFKRLTTGANRFTYEYFAKKYNKQS